MAQRPLRILFCKLDELLESTVDGRADIGHVLVELDGGNSTLADTLWVNSNFCSGISTNLGKY